MKPAPFSYHAPTRLDEALALLADAGGDVRPLAGGQSLVPMLSMRVLRVDALVDLNGIAALAGIRDEGARMHVGAMTRQRELERSAALGARCPLVAQALRHVGHRQTRNRGTIGGSLAHLDPAAELPAVMHALDATVHLCSRRGVRDVAMARFPLDLLTPDLAPDELLTGVSFVPWPPGHGYAFEEYARRHGDFALVCVAVLLALDASHRITRAAVVLSGIGTSPVRCTDAETLLVGSRAHCAFDDAADAAGALDAVSDLHAQGGYRRHLARTLTRRALTRALERATGTGEGPC